MPFLGLLATILAGAGLAIAAGSPAVVGWLTAQRDGRFGTTLAELAGCLDPRSAEGLAIWLGQQLLLVAAATSQVIRGMLRRRQPPAGVGFSFLSAILLVASLGAQVPVGRFVSAAASEATGLRFGPGGCGWWIAVAGIALVAATVPAVLALSNRLAALPWLVAAGAAWTLSAAAVPAGFAQGPFVAAAAWVAGAAAVLGGLLTVARGIIREIRVQHPLHAAVTRAKAPEGPAHPVEARRADSVEEIDGAETTAVAAPTLYTDGSDADDRQLSKAERKRLRKQARIREAEEAAAAA